MRERLCLGLNLLGEWGSVLVGFGQGSSKCAGVFGEGRDVKCQVTKSQCPLDVLSSYQLKLSGCSSSKQHHQSAEQIPSCPSASGGHRFLKVLSLILWFSLVEKDFKCEWNIKCDPVMLSLNTL